MSTLKELNVKPGDIVTFYDGRYQHKIISFDGERADALRVWDGEVSSIPNKGSDPWRIVSRASDQPKHWGDMTPEEKGALLLAHHDGKVIEIYGEIYGNRGWSVVIEPKWIQEHSYRVQPECKIKTIMLYCGSMDFDPAGDYTDAKVYGDIHLITFNLIEGKPDCQSIKMESIGVQHNDF
jgi:hypothetical protein